MIKEIYNKFWDWSSHAGTIVNARITALTGLFTSAISYMDWSPLWNLLGVDTGFSTKQAFWLGAGLMIKGIFDELVRRAHTITTESGKLISRDVTIPEIKAAKKNTK